MVGGKKGLAKGFKPGLKTSLGAFGKKLKAYGFRGIDTFLLENNVKLELLVQYFTDKGISIEITLG